MAHTFPVRCTVVVVADALSFAVWFASSPLLHGDYSLAVETSMHSQAPARICVWSSGGLVGIVIADLASLVSANCLSATCNGNVGAMRGKAFWCLLGWICQDSGDCPCLTHFHASSWVPNCGSRLVFVFETQTRSHAPHTACHSWNCGNWFSRFWVVEEARWQCSQIAAGSLAVSYSCWDLPQSNCHFVFVFVFGIFCLLLFLTVHRSDPEWWGFSHSGLLYPYVLFLVSLLLARVCCYRSCFPSPESATFRCRSTVVTFCTNDLVSTSAVVVLQVPPRLRCNDFWCRDRNMSTRLDHFVKGAHFDYFMCECRALLSAGNQLPLYICVAVLGLEVETYSTQRSWSVVL